MLPGIMIVTRTDDSMLTFKHGWINGNPPAYILGRYVKTEADGCMYCCVQQHMHSALGVLWQPLLWALAEAACLVQWHGVECLLHGMLVVWLERVLSMCIMLGCHWVRRAQQSGKKRACDFCSACMDEFAYE
jgi:hypothetical protein